MEVRHRLEENKQIEPETSSESDNEILNTNSNHSNWRKDRWNISLLLFLYLLQGIPLGMAASIPLIIQTYGASWSQQATFSFAFWPFSLKLLWAPIVDALYFKKFGRRKSWLIPIQYALGFVMILLSYYINEILHDPAPSSSHHPRMLKKFYSEIFIFYNLDIYFLTLIFFGLSFLAATQDICVDGWALSMLSR
jgi:PAT family acetyl-CoA transporter-like MFS transporter 1